MDANFKNISLIICTKDRAKALEQCLKEIQKSDISRINAELILVDNGSSDNTGEIIRRFVENNSFPVIHVTEPKKGLSNARNAGLNAATGKIIAFTDDDCYIEKNYFFSVTRAFEDVDYDYFGGRIMRYYKADAFYACNEKNAFEPIKSKSFIPAGLIQGANMAFTEKLIKKVGLFDPILGAGAQFRCEDVDYIARASYLGFSGAHVPEVIVWHHHGRKEGDNLENIKRENDYSRGAYYAKQFSNGYKWIIYHWLKTTWQLRGHHHLRDELKGAFDYLTFLKNGSNLNK